MKIITKIKAMLFSLMMIVGLIIPTTATAQRSDGFFKSSDNYENRTSGIDITDEGGISNYGIGETVPLGSGLLILTAVGAGYAITSRRRNKGFKAINGLKGINAIIIISALLLTMPSCKKKVVETVTPEATNGVLITLDVDGGSKVIVNPTGHTNPNYATVTFEKNDIIYVGNNGAYCGYLEHDGTNFTGTVNPTSQDDYLHFYFMGNKGGKSQPSSVSISDQTSKYPVISYAHSTKKYNSGTTAYTAKLQNYCAIVKFTTTNIPQATAITITGMNNTVAVNFAANNAAASNIGEPYTFSKTGKGNITIHAESNTERWAILIPQDEVTTAMAYAAGYATASAFTVPTISANGYYTNNGTGYGIALAVESHQHVDLGLPSGTLWATHNVGATNLEDYGYYIAWGETTPKADYSWTTYAFDNSANHDGSSFSKYTGSDYSVLQPADDAARQNWGIHWRMPTSAEWQELIDNTDKEWTTISGVQGGKFMKKTDHSVYIFLPAGGLRDGTNGNWGLGTNGRYWSSSLKTDEPIRAFMTSCDNDEDRPYDASYRYFGRSVRPVWAH